MKRRSCLQMVLAGTGLLALRGMNAQRPASDEHEHAIELHLDLAVDPAREQEMLRVFQEEFRPAASKQPGFIAVKMLKLSATLRGPAPPGSNYRFVLSFKDEDTRKNWVETPTHKALWPKIVATLSNPTYSRLLYEVY